MPEEDSRRDHEAGADYALSLKGNQETAHDEEKSYLDDAVSRWKKEPEAVPEMGFAETVKKDHGRIETQRFWQSCDVAWFADLGEWKRLRSFGVAESVRDVGGGTTERRYYLLSLGKAVWIFALASRRHWGVENNVHWLLDVTFKEDQSRARAGYAAENLSTLRRLSLNALKRETSKRSMRQKVKDAGWSNAFLLSVLGIDPS